MNNDKQILENQASKLRAMIDSGLGLTNKPISKKRIGWLKRNLAQIEADLKVLETKPEKAAANPKS